VNAKHEKERFEQEMERVKQEKARIEQERKHTAAESALFTLPRPQAQDFFYSKGEAQDAQDLRSRKERKTQQEKASHTFALKNEIMKRTAAEDFDYGPLPPTPPSVWKGKENSMMLRLGMKEERLVREKKQRIARMFDGIDEAYVAHWQQVGAGARKYVENESY
jgi:hypothetical protein